MSEAAAAGAGIGTIADGCGVVAPEPDPAHAPALPSGLPLRAVARRPA